MFFQLLLSAFVFILNFSIGELYHYPKNITLWNNLLFLLYFLINSLLFVLVFRTLQKDNELKLKLSCKESLDEYMKTLEQINHSYRAFKHDYANILYSLRGFIDADNTQGLHDYFHEHILPSANQMQALDHQLERLSNIQIMSLKGFLYAKLQDAATSGLQLHLEVDDSINHINIDEVDLIRILGIFLDNAIEASIKTEDRKLIVLLINKEDNITIQIINSRLYDAASENQLGTPGFTTKGEGHGIGLSNVAKLIEKYSNILWETKHTTTEFTQTLKIFIS